MRVLVTGGLGYIGRAVTARLAEAGHDVAILARARPDAQADLPGHAELLLGDVRDRDHILELVAGGDFAGVCHLAGRTRGRESFGDPVGYYDTNLSGTVNLLRGLGEATRRSGEPARLVFASTVMVYGSSDGRPIDEQHETAPMSPYGASKLACEQLLAYQAAAGALGAISLRVFAAAGAVGRHGDRDLGRLIPKALAVARGQEPYIEVNGDGSAVREFTHVADVAEAYLRALDAVKPGEHEVYNIGSGSGVSVREILAMVEEVTGRPVPVRHRPAQPEPAALIADYRRAQERLGWQPSRSALRQIIADAWQAETNSSEAVARR
jgi:UDP-glucose 4-epimerase